MARIRNSSQDNLYGEGKEKIITLDNGEEYVIRNSAMPNLYGDGREQIIEKRGTQAPLKYNKTLVGISGIMLLLSALCFIIGLFVLKSESFLHLALIFFILMLVITAIDSIINFFK